MLAIQKLYCTPTLGAGRMYQVAEKNTRVAVPDVFDELADRIAKWTQRLAEALEQGSVAI